MADRETLHQSLLRERQRYQSRRWFFKECGVGIGGIALASLLGARGSTRWLIRVRSTIAMPTFRCI